MATNRDWLFSLPLEEQLAWMNAEHAESPTSATMQYIGQVIEDTVKRGVYGDTESDNEDSRDKIEADVRKIAEAYNMDTQRHGTEHFEHELYCSIIHLLNRQRAIDDSICDECSSDYYEMQEEHDHMLDGIAKLMRLKQPYTFDPDKPLENIETIGRYIDELTAERDNWKSCWEKCKAQSDAILAERELYREALSQLLDAVIDGMGKVSAILDNYDEGMA